MVCKSKANHHQILLLSKAEFEKIVWLKQHKEFRLDGRLYDVESIEMKNNEVAIHVEEDTQELKLILEFITQFTSETENKNNSSPIKILLQHFMQEFTFNATFEIPLTILSSVIFFEKEFSYVSFILNGQSPPPDLLLC